MSIKRLFPLLFLLTAACATAPTETTALAEFQKTNDPLEPFNRAVFSFNTVTGDYVLRPIVDGYRFIVPKPTRTGIANFFDNLNAPITIVNEMLQGRFKNAGVSGARMFINTFAGFFGVYDVAEKAGFEKEKTGFSDTLGVWGIPAGPYLVLPFFGPSDIRDATGLTADIFINPMTYVAHNQHKRELVYFFRAEVALNALAQYDNAVDLLDDLRKNSLDFYAATRSMYQQYRDARIARLSGATNATGIPNDTDENAAYEFSLDD